MKLEDFLTYLDDLCSETVTEEELEALYHQPIIITFSDHTVTIPFNPHSYQALYEMINKLCEVQDNEH